MRICHVIESGATGALQMVLLMAEMQRRNFDQVLIVYSRRPGSPSDLRARVNSAIELAHLRMRPLAPHLITWCWRFAKLLRRWNPDIVHFHGSRAGFLGRMVAGRRRGRRACYSPHCISLMHLNLSGVQRALYRALERFANKVCPAVYVACTEPERAVIAREIQAPAHLLENAVETGLGAFVNPRRPRNRLLRLVVTCARIADLKDPALFADVCRTVRSVRPDIEFRWIGDGDRRGREMLEHSGVRVTGWVPRDEALRQIAEGCVYLSTSGWEGLPVSVLEAMFLRVPVLCRRAEWSEAIIRDGETGRLFDDAQSAAKVLLSGDTAWLQQVSEAGWTAAQERFSEARFAAGLTRIYRETLSSTPTV